MDHNLKSRTHQQPDLKGENPVERTLVFLKPDAVQRCLIGTLISRFENRGLKLLALKMTLVSEDLAKQHYAAHLGKGFFDSLIKFITSSPIVLLVLEADRAVEITRSTIGATDPLEAITGTVRGDFGLSVQNNLIHASDSQESASREIDLFFSNEELVSYTKDIDGWIIES